MEFLLEINVEEMPLAHVRSALTDMSERIRKELLAARIAVEGWRSFSTTRRLILTADLSAGQPDRDELVTGPPKAAAYAADGSPTPAALGFARSKGVDVSELQVVKTEKGEYVGVRKAVKGRRTADVLSKALPVIIASLSFPKPMRWGTGSLRFSRPIRGLLCLLGGEIVPFSLEGLVSGNRTTGHKLHAPEPFEIRSFEDYRGGLAGRHVTIDPEERKASILSQMSALLAPLKAEMYPDSALLDKLANDVESPFVVMGSFPEAFLDLPLEVLSTAMREGQKLFSVVKGGKQLPLFLGVADVTADARGFIRAGHERVLKARLADARFFWEQDLKTGFQKCAPRLKQVLFQEKLGSYDDKARRLEKLTAYLCGKVESCRKAPELKQAASLCKVDLVTDMVREFPALQGTMGGLYAKTEGLSQPVARAIAEHYLPAGADDPSPSSIEGAILSLADKIDSIVGVVGVGVQTSGSSDPFGLRRNAQGVCKIILDKKISLPFTRLLEKSISFYGDKLKLPKAEILDRLREFFAGRLRYLLEKEGIRYDLIHAALGAGLDDPYYAALRARALDTLKDGPQFEPLILMAKRVNNILAGQNPPSVNPAHFVEKAERELYSTSGIILENVSPMIAKGDFVQAQKVVFRLQPVLNVFFEKVMVMAEETKLRKNRLALLAAIRKTMLRIADYAQVVVEGEKGNRSA
ncbi:MAG: glycine--tRNA ligase subunit beta [Candidatus Aminicenantes bacterium]|nr:glycine--tRNA ligase subunit beta [Candidatus Aminicenantes bacterium]